MKRTMKIFSIALIVYFLWTEVWIGLFMGADIYYSSMGV